MNQKQAIENRYRNAQLFEHQSTIHRNCIRLNGLMTGKVSDEHQIGVNKLCLEAAKEGHHFLTEARLKDGSRIADFVDLENNTVIEIAVSEKEDSLVEKEKFWIGLGFQFEVRRHVPEIRVVFPAVKKVIRVPFTGIGVTWELTVCSKCYSPVPSTVKDCPYCAEKFGGEHGV